MAKRLKKVTRQRQDVWFANHVASIASGQYEPFWRVEDINSYGIKVKVRAFNNKNRVVHLLSINELLMYMQIAWDSCIVECYEQYALPLDVTLEIASKLNIKHPVYSDTRVPMVQTLDFMCTRDDGSLIAFPVKQESSLLEERTVEKLAIQESYCLISDIDYLLVSSDDLKTERCQNLERLYRHAELDSLLHGAFDVWLQNFIGILSEDRHERVANILDRSSQVTGVEYQRSAHFFYHAIWIGKLIFNWFCPLYLEAAASDMELYANDVAG